MSNVLHKGTDGSLYFWCPGCQQLHRVRPKGSLSNGPEWDWNGSMEKPTFNPSILNMEVLEGGRMMFTPRCHSYVRDGVIGFLSDCGHDKAGQNIPLSPNPLDQTP